MPCLLPVLILGLELVSPFSRLDMPDHWNVQVEHFSSGLLASYRAGGILLLSWSFMSMYHTI